MSLVVQSDRCTGCRLCEQICAIEHFGETNPKKAAIHIEGLFPAPGHYRHHVCNRCYACIDVCPTSAIVKADSGAVVVKIDDCIACWACVDACPENAIFTHASLQVPIICDACHACTEVCNTGALTRGA
jgi:anaerobic carbon-monoxide dehydrogenase iron sulfur subunit